MDFESLFGTRIEHLQPSIGYSFIERPLAAEALHDDGPDESWFMSHGRPQHTPKNDHLAVDGRTAMCVVLASEWYHDEAPDRATWAYVRDKALNSDALAETGLAHGLDLCIKRAVGARSVTKQVMATAVEAIHGAVHLDGGDDALRYLMYHLNLVGEGSLPQKIGFP